MNRIITSTIIALVAVITMPRERAWADDPAPTKAQLDAAKQAFDEAQVLYSTRKFHEAIAKLQDSYKLSRNAFLLYNIAHAYDQIGDQPKALAFYLKFLELTPATAAKRDETTKRVDELKQANVEADLEATASLFEKPVEPTAPTSRYSQTDFRHRLVDTVQPGKPIDIVAEAPREANWVVTLFYRGAGEDTYTALPMAWKDQVLVGQIPGAKVAGNAIQYYLEVKDAEGTVVTRSGKRTSPNLVKIEDRTSVVTTLPDDPLHNPRIDRPARKLFTPTSVSTAAAVVLIGGAVTTYFLAKDKSDALRTDSTACGVPPCQVFDAGYDQGIETSGVRYNRIYKVMLGASVVGVGVAGYFWYRSLRTKHEVTVGATSGSPRAPWAVAPAFGDGFTGALAARRF